MLTHRTAIPILTFAIFAVIIQIVLSAGDGISAREELTTSAMSHAPSGLAVTVRVIPQSNRRPSLTVSIPLGAETVSEGDHVAIGLAAEDPDGTVPTLSGAGLPNNAAIVDSGDGNGALLFSPDFDQAGEYAITVIASDESLADSVQVLMQVSETNRRPVLSAAARLATREGGRLVSGVQAIDDDGTIPVISAALLPTNATWVDSGNGAAYLDFRPAYDQSGEHTITIVASDGSLSDTASILIAVADATLPSTFSLNQNFPNPFNSSTIIMFTLGETGTSIGSHARLDIVNILGQTVRTLIDEDLGPGPHTYSWDGRDNSSRPTASGIYFYRLSARGTITTRKMVQLK